MVNLESGQPDMDANGYQPWGKFAAWLLFACGLACFVFAETWLAEPAYFAFGVFSTRWWIALSLVALIILMATLTGMFAIRTVNVLRNRSGIAGMLRASAIFLGLGVIEIVVAVSVAIIALILLPGFQVIPVVHVHVR